MRKYIISTILVIIGVYLVVLGLRNKNNPTYAETAFAQEAKKFDTTFDQFSSSVKNTFFSIKGDFDKKVSIVDSLQLRQYFFDQLKLNNSISSIGFFQGNYKVVTRNENPTYVFAIDTSAELNVVKWQRFQDQKIISNWYESFEESVYNTAWFKELIPQENEIKWNIDDRNSSNNSIEKQEFFYAGYSCMLDDKKTVIILEFSKDKLLKEFNITSGNVIPRLSFMNLKGKELIVNREYLGLKTDSLNQTNAVDSLKLILTKHFDNFKDVPEGTFTFNYKDQTYWNSFKRLSEESGIQYYLYTIPSSQLIQSSTGLFGDNELWFGIGFIILSGLFLLIRKRFFYRANRMKVQPVEEILMQEENRYLEFKSSLRWDYRQEKVNPELEKVIMKTVAAFGNTDGGILLIGVDDDKNILGLKKDFQSLKKTDADYYEVHLRNIMHKLMGVKYVSKYIRTQFEEIEGKTICKIKVIPAKEPLFLKYTNKNGQAIEKFYVRSGNSSQEIKSIAEINDYINTKFKK